MSRCRRMSRLGIVYSMSEHGTARLIFDDDRAAFEGVLETSTGETVSLRGRLSENSPVPSTSAGPVLMDVFIVDGEAGSSFQLDHIIVNIDGNQIAIQNPAITFTTTEKLIGMKADVEIQQYLRPNLTHEKRELFVGPMKLQLLTSHRPQPSVRRESICDTDVIILEESDDFLA